MSDDILRQVKLSAQKKILFLPHTIQQMSHPERMITTKEVERVVNTGEIIEDYPDDVRGHIGFWYSGKSDSCCLFAKGRLFSHYYSLLTESKSMVIRF